MNPVLHSSAVHTWQTPESFLERVRRLGPIALDPCTSVENPTGAGMFIHPGNGDGLSAPWAQYAQGGLTFVNCPYGRALSAWADKIAMEAAEGCEIIVLVPSRTDTKWWQRLFTMAEVTLFWRGRIKFLNADPAAPSRDVMWAPKKSSWVPVAPAAFPSAVFYFGRRQEAFREAFAGKGVFV